MYGTLNIARNDLLSGYIIKCICMTSLYRIQSVSEVKPHIDLVETWNNFFRAQLISIITFIMRAGIT